MRSCSVLLPALLAGFSAVYVSTAIADEAPALALAAGLEARIARLEADLLAVRTEREALRARDQTNAEANAAEIERLVRERLQTEEALRSLRAEAEAQQASSDDTVRLYVDAANKLKDELAQQKQENLALRSEREAEKALQAASVEAARTESAATLAAELSKQQQALLQENKALQAERDALLARESSSLAAESDRPQALESLKAAHAAEQQALRQEASSLQAQLKAVEARHRAETETAARANGDAIAQLQSQNTSAQDALRKELASLRAERDALKQRELEAAGTAQAQTTRLAVLSEELLVMQKELAGARTARDELSVNARALAGELRNVRVERDKYQRDAIMAAARADRLQGAAQAVQATLR